MVSTIRPMVSTNRPKVSTIRPKDEIQRKIYLYAEVQPVFANFICKDSDNRGIFAKFAAEFNKS